jgi:hypothetical protein
MGGAIYVDPWAASYQTAYLVAPDEAAAFGGNAEPVEDGDEITFHAPDPSRVGRRDRLAFVDGVRRGDATLYQEHPDTGDPVRGVAGSHACGAVLVEPGERPVFGPTHVTRLVIWGCGQVGALPDVAGGWSWKVLSTPGTGPDDPLLALQNRMRAAEQELARALFHDGYLTLLDGPLSRLHSLGGERLVGYVKTHSNVLLPIEHHRRIAHLPGGYRTSMFRLGAERYSCYLRLIDQPSTAPPWSAVVRIEMPADSGLSAAIDVADALTVALPRFAGIAHRDPRAPQNLQPVGALEKHLRHLLGDPGLAMRAVRTAVTQLVQAAPAGAITA